MGEHIWGGKTKCSKNLEAVPGAVRVLAGSGCWVKCNKKPRTVAENSGAGQWQPSSCKQPGDAPSGGGMSWTPRFSPETPEQMVRVISSVEKVPVEWTLIRAKAYQR